MVDIQFFRTPFATITKSYRGDNGEMFVEGIASSTNLDQTKEKMSPEAIKLMAAKFQGKPLNSEHQNDWDSNLGKIIESKVIDSQGGPALWIKAKLNDWMSRAKDLFTGLNTGELALGFSVEGHINPGGLVKEFDPALGYSVPVYRDIEPGAVAVTNKPANLDTFCNAVTKSLSKSGISIEDLPELRNGSLILVKKVLEGQVVGESIEKDGKTIHESKVTKDGVDLNPNVEGNPMLDNQTLDCSDSVCPHGMCTNKACKNMCEKCTTAKAVDINYAGPIPASGLARQDMAVVDEGKKDEKTETAKATTADPTNVQANPVPVPATTDQTLAQQPTTTPCTGDYCEHGNCLEKGCPNACGVCAIDVADDLLDGEDKLDKAVTNAHAKKPGKYADVPEEKFLDPENHKYPADAKHLPAALAYFNHSGQRAAGGYNPSKWADMGRKLAGLLGGGYHYDASSEKVVQGESQGNAKGDAKKSSNEGGELNNMLHNDGVLQKTQYSQEVLDIIKAWGGTNPGNQEMFAKADASAVSQQQTVQKGSSSSSSPSSSGSSSGSGSSSSGSGSSPDSSDSSDSSSDSSSGESLSSLLSSVLTTLSDMKSSVSGSSSDSSSGSDSSSTGSKTSTDKNFPFQGGKGSSSASDKTSTDKRFSSASSSNEPKTSANKAFGSSPDSASDTDEATKALAIALQNFQAALEKTTHQPSDGNFAENGTQEASPTGQEGNDNVNGSAQEPDEDKDARSNVPMPKANTGSTDNVNGSAQEPDYNSLATKSMVANQEKFVKSIDTLTALMTKLGQKVESVEGKVDAMPNVRKGIAINKNFTQEEQAEFVKTEQVRKDTESRLVADPRTTFRELHQFRTYNVVPAWFQNQG